MYYLSTTISTVCFLLGDRLKHLKTKLLQGILEILPFLESSQHDKSIGGHISSKRTHCNVKFPVVYIFVCNH
jgi:hypothetical protein